MNTFLSIIGLLLLLVIVWAIAKFVLKLCRACYWVRPDGNPGNWHTCHSLYICILIVFAATQN